MLTFERASKILLGAYNRIDFMSPLDYVLNAVNSDIDIVHDYDPDYSILN
jgi:hypothetical protein